MGQVPTVVLLGRPASGKTAIWLSLAAAFGDPRLRLETADGPPLRLAWPVAVRRFLVGAERHGVRVARIGGPGGAPSRTASWSASLRLVDGPGLGAAVADGAAELLAECLAATLVLHVVAGGIGEVAAIDAAVGEFGRVRSVAVERVRLGAPTRRGTEGVRAVAAPGSDGQAGKGAPALVALVRARIGLHPFAANASVGRWWSVGLVRNR